MDFKIFFTVIRQKAKATDWLLLAFLVLLLNVKLVVKAAAILLMLVFRFNRRTGLRLKQPRLPLFYPVMMGIGLLSAVAGGHLTGLNYLMVLAVGLFSWLFCFIAIHQLKTTVERTDPEILHRTLLLFFVLNIVVSFVVYAGIVWETGTINPYRYQGQYQKYFIGTGDYIKGISFDTSTTNAVINAFGVVYFLQRRQYVMTLCCMSVLLLTGSNMVNLLLCLTLLFRFVLGTGRSQKSIIVVCMLMLVTFLAKVSPQNNQYISEVWKRITSQPIPPIVIPGHVIPLQLRPDSVLDREQQKEKIALLYLDSMNRVLLGRQAAAPAVTENNKPAIPVANIHTPPYQHRSDTTLIEQRLMDFIAAHKAELQLADQPVMEKDKPGKWIALRQTLHFLSAHPLYWVMGAGMGNFSSKLAFRATALNIAGGYPQRFQYINPGFTSNHLDLYLHYFAHTDGLHSVTNSPNSVYDQLIAEYGLTGIAAFFFLYIWYFLRHYKKMTYGIPVLLLVLGICGTDYWFEQLSVLPFAELLLFLNIKEGNKGVPV